MDRRTILAIILSLGIYYAWLALRGPQQPPPDAETPVAVAPAPVEPAPAEPPPVESNLPIVDVPFEACGVRGLVSTDGGRLHSVEFPDLHGHYQVTPLYSWLWGRLTGGIEGPWKPWGDPPPTATVLTDGAEALSTGVGPTDQPVRMQVASQQPGVLELVGTAQGVEIRKRYAEQPLEGGGCQIAATTTWTNVSGQPIQGEAWIAVRDRAAGEAGSSYESTPQPTALVDGDMVYGGSLGAGCVRAGTQLTDEQPRIELPGEVSWFGVSDRYFGFYVVPPATLGGELVLEREQVDEAAVDGGVLTFPLALAAGEARTEAFEVYAGPNETERLAAVEPTLTRAVDLGFFAMFAWPLLWLLRAFHGVLDNWGLSIIALTVLVKALFFPMTQKSFKSMSKMQAIQPELTRIREEYADQPQEMNRRTMELMAEHGVNPLSGCLPMFLQMPVFIALYNVLLTSVELYQKDFLYLRDLTSPDPYLVLPISITFLMWLQQQFSTPAAGMDPVQQQVLRWMPLGFGLFFFASPSGLGVYFFVNIALSILQQWWIKRSIGTGSPPAAAAVAGA